MADLKVKDRSGNEVETVSVRDDVFGKYVNRRLLRDALVMYEANRRQGTASTKTRSEVAGSGRKPWRQKGTGRARAGTVRSPIARKGGIVFGPKPRDFSYSMPRKALRKALANALLSKIRNSEMHLVDSLEFEKPRAKEMSEVLRNFGLAGSVAIVVGPSDKNAYLSARNVPKARVRKASELNAMDVLACRHVLVTKEAFETLRTRVGTQMKGEAQE